MLLGEKAKIIQRQYLTCDDRPGNAVILEKDNKLFHYDEGIGEFILLFDYNAKQNDKIKIPTWESLYSPTDTIYTFIDTVYETIVNDQPLKKYLVTYFKYPNFSEKLFSDTILQHIGILNNIVLLTEGWICHGFYNNGLRCFEHPTLGTFSFVDTNCDFIENDGTAVNDNQLNYNITISPNPAYNDLTIKTPDLTRDVTIKILDLSGRIVQQKLFYKPSKNKTIDISSINSGLYIIIVEDYSTQKQHVSRIIKL